MYTSVKSRRVTTYHNSLKQNKFSWGFLFCNNHGRNVCISYGLQHFKMFAGRTLNRCDRSRFPDYLAVANPCFTGNDTETGNVRNVTWAPVCARSKLEFFSENDIRQNQSNKSTPPYFMLEGRYAFWHMCKAFERWFSKRNFCSCRNTEQNVRRTGGI